MDCPVCKEPMVVLELHEVEIDHCIECKGVWLDAGELELLLESAKGKDDLISSFHLVQKTDEKLRKCPICLKKMEKIWVGDEQVMIDRCKKRDGIWFDTGELEEIIKLGAVGEDNKVLGLIKDIFGKQ